MKISVLHLIIGIPGSGKTYWAEEQKRKHPFTHIISTDEIRKEITGVEQCIDPSQNDMIHAEARKRVKDLIQNVEKAPGLGVDIIVDSTNTELQEWIEYKKLHPTIFIADVFNCEIEDAVHNQQFRERKVPREIIEMKKKQFDENKKYLNSFFNMVIFH